LIIGSFAYYKETQKCVILGFSENVKADEDLFGVEKINKLKSTMYCKDPTKQKALVLFIGEGKITFAPEVRAVDVFSLVPMTLSRP
jgi:hypothetical protein